jgi:hypothetical protein
MAARKSSRDQRPIDMVYILVVALTLTLITYWWWAILA